MLTKDNLDIYIIKAMEGKRLTDAERKQFDTLLLIRILEELQHICDNTQRG